MEAYEKPQSVCPLQVKGRNLGENKIKTEEQEFRHTKPLMQYYMHR